MCCSKLGSTPVEEWFERHGRRGPFEDERAPRYAGVYYWQKATDNEEREFKIKLTASDDEAQTLMVLRGGKECELLDGDAEHTRETQGDQ